MTNIQSQLADRLKSCMLDNLGFEELDCLKAWPHGRGKTDFIRREGRGILVEQKDLQRNDIADYQAFSDFVGEASLKYNQEVFDLTMWSPTDKQRFLDLQDKAMRRLGRVMRKASAQIGDSKLVLGLPDAYGLCLVVNELAGNLGDGLSCWLISNLLEPCLKPSDHDTAHLDGFIYVQRLVGRKSFAGTDSIVLAHLRNAPRSDELAPVVKAMVEAFYPGIQLKHPKDIFLPNAS